MENENLRPTAAVAAAEEDDEEMKMEAFFALVRNFKEMRDRRREELTTIGDGGEADQASEKKRKKMKTAPSAWIPTFLREDFDEDFQVGGPPPVLPKPCNLIKEDTPPPPPTPAAVAKKKKKKMKSDEECLDLNLAL